MKRRDSEIEKKNEATPKRKLRGRKQTGLNVWLLTFAVFGLVAAAGIFFLIQIANYEDGVVEIYATQQDAYVQLVLDQINLVEDRSDSEIVTNILGTLDASSNKYWTLTHDQALVFVKDVMETNRYKGFTTETYYISDSAREFIRDLQVNRVTHRLIQIQDKKFIASGVKFFYHDHDYQICLLTNPDAVLDHNAYMNARINLDIMMLLILSVFLVTVIVMAMRLEAIRRAKEREMQVCEELRKRVQRLDDRLSGEELYDPRFMVFQAGMLDVFVEKLAERKIYPVTLAVVDYETDIDKEYFLSKAQLAKARRIVRFELDTNRVLFVAVGLDGREAMKVLASFMGCGASLVGKAVMTEDTELSFGQCIDKILEKSDEDER